VKIDRFHAAWGTILDFIYFRTLIGPENCTKYGECSKEKKFPQKAPFVALRFDVKRV
jgi:hypothetical protein